MLKVLEQFCTTNDMRISTKKTKYMCFGSNVTNDSMSVPLSVYDNVIEKVPKFKYLGLTFDLNATTKFMM